MQNSQTQIAYKKPSTTKKTNRVQNIRIKVWQYKAVKCSEI